ncbi:MAG: hypothetical protein K0S11_119 [Gammaproteobacteria bacterium]|jgi:uncharacterized integral membrane protein (TIGR00698 family)|nr:hypothetical protein [Gammaproteobacteria bacterium]
MISARENRLGKLNGIFFVCLFALTSYYLAGMSWFIQHGISPLIIAILLGMTYSATLRSQLPSHWVPGIQFAAKRLLRIAIVLYGFRISFQQVASIGLTGFILDLLIVALTLIFGTLIGIKVFKLDRDTALLISSGSAICGAAAVLATESVLKSEPYKASIAVASVVLFGTAAMFLYPFIQHLGILGFNDTQYGIYAGATVHEVAQVLVAGAQISSQTADTAVIVKMTRVMMLAPLLLGLGIYFARANQTGQKVKFSKTIPWFAVVFIAVVGFNSLNLLPVSAINALNQLDTLLLTLAMAALGIETNFSKIKQVGLKPLYLATVLFIWLVVGGYFLTKWLVTHPIGMG